MVTLLPWIAFLFLFALTVVIAHRRRRMWETSAFEVQKGIDFHDSGAHSRDLVLKLIVEALFVVDVISFVIAISITLSATR